MTLADALYILIMYLNCVFEIFLLYIFLEASFLVFEKRKSIILIESIVCATAIYGVNSLKSPTVNLVSVPLIFLFFVWLVFRMKLKFNLLFVTCFYVIVAVSEFIFFYVYKLLNVDTGTADFNRIFFLIIQNLFRFVVIQLIKKQNRGFYNQSNDNFQYLKSLYLLPIATIILLNGILAPLKNPLGYILICLGGILIIVSNVSDFFIVEKLLKAINTAKDAEMLLLKSQLEQKHFQRMEEVNQEYANYMHEMNHMLRIMEQVAYTENNSEIKKLAKNISSKGYPAVKKNYINNNIMNAIFIEREKMALDKGIEYSVVIQAGLDFDFIDDMDKISMFGNLLDNALEAASVSSKGFVSVSLNRGNDNFIVFVVENNFKYKPQKKGMEYLTIKQEKEKHGFGLKTVEKISLKYGGMLNITETENTFMVTLLFSNLQIMDN